MAIGVVYCAIYYVSVNLRSGGGRRGTKAALARAVVEEARRAVSARLRLVPRRGRMAPTGSLTCGRGRQFGRRPATPTTLSIRLGRGCRRHKLAQKALLNTIQGRSLDVH